MEPIDLLITARWVLPIVPKGVLEDAAVACHQGRIVAVLSKIEALRRYQPTRTVHLPHHILLPGLVNSHTHAAMTLLRGYADDLPLQRWLHEKIWPAERKWVSDDFVYQGTLLAAWEMLRGGITCFGDMYFFPKAAARAALHAGIRAQLGLVALDLPTAYATTIDDYLYEGFACRDEYIDEELLSFCLAPHAPYSLDDQALEKIVLYSRQLSLNIITHLHETKQEIADSLKEHGQRPLMRLAHLGLLESNFIGVHMVHLTDDERAILARQGCQVVHCPTANLKLGSGIADVPALHAAAIPIGLGSDGAASNNRLDIFQEMRHAALLAAVQTGHPPLSAHDILHMATLGGATALGLQEHIGTLTAGKCADLCAVKLDQVLELTPCFDPLSHLVFAAGREHVTHSWVAGEAKVAEGTLVGVDAEHISALLASCRVVR